jgi:hypothetical protein
MPRYFVVPRPPTAIEAGDDFWEPSARSMEVLVPSDEPANTGLVDQFGASIYRMPTRRPVGFAR